MQPKQRAAATDATIDTEDSHYAAYHEAGHTVAAYEFGWYLRHGGVCIGERAQACLRAPCELRTTQAEIIVAMAGWVAEAKYRDLSSLVACDEILDAITRHRSWLGQDPSSSFSDPMTVAGQILKAHPSINRRSARVLVRRFEIETMKLMNEPRVWSAVERIAAALVRRRRLSHNSAVHLLGRDFFTEVMVVQLLNCGA
jgi:hypothetical protein